jgi:mannose/fructose/N-acetylgalactosamine-specific phosphotransferase system component IIB
MSKEVIAEHLDKGWIHARMFFEVLAASEEIARDSLKKHLGSVKKMENIKIVEEKYEDVVEVDDPPKQFKGSKAYSQVCEVDVVVRSVENLVYSVIFFGPSSIEIISPKEMKMRFEEVQSMANAVAEIMHRYASAGAGGIIISGKK